MRALYGCVAASAVVVLVVGCAQVPKESIALSETVGRDVAAIEKSHRKFIDLVYDDYEKDVNTFVDDVYLPHYIHENLQTPAGKKLLDALQEAAKPGSTEQQRKDAYETAEIWLKVAHRRVANMRTKLLAPLKAQRRQITQDLDDAYDRVHKANAAVTGYLASLAKVTDLQNNLLDQLGVPNLSERVGEAALQISSTLNKEMPAAEKKVAEIEAVRDKLQEYLRRWRRETPNP